MNKQIKTHTIGCLTLNGKPTLLKEETQTGGQQGEQENDNKFLRAQTIGAQSGVQHPD